MYGKIQLVRKGNSRCFVFDESHIEIVKPDDVVGFVVHRDFIIGKTGTIFTLEEWDALPQETKDENIFKS